MPDLSPDLLNHFQDLIYRQYSLRFSPSRQIGLEMRLRERLNNLELPSYEAYFDLLQNDFEEFDLFIEGITTKETYFFRLPDQFKALTKHILPRIEERLSKEVQRLIAEEGWSGAKKMPIRVWSAGCATGEEAYSIAMTIMEGLKYPKAWHTEILATDISREALTKARMGFYETSVLKKISSHYQKKYMRICNGGAVMRDAILERMDFRIFNLRHLNDYKGGPCPFIDLDGTREKRDLSELFDMIFCRNVMIYFDFNAQQQLVDNLYGCLKPGGYLFTGDAELLRIYKHHFETLEFEGAYLYQKPD
jgi:chemotaxis protein methyltransferase CheR